MCSLISYLLWYLSEKIKLWWCVKHSRTEVERQLCHIIHFKHPKDFRQDLHAWWIFRKLTPSDLSLILADDMMDFCESYCDEIDSEDAGCDYCKLLTMKPFFDKWYPEKSQLIGRFDRKNFNAPLNTIEIIGNIYENPDILNQGD